MLLLEPSSSAIGSSYMHPGGGGGGGGGNDHAKRMGEATTMPKGSSSKPHDRPSGVPAREKLDDRKSVFAQFDVCGRFPQVESISTLWADLPVSAIHISQVVAFSRTHSIHLNPRIEGTEIACPQFSGGRKDRYDCDVK